jgi:hypothetical protein
MGSKVQGSEVQESEFMVRPHFLCRSKIILLQFTCRRDDLRHAQSASEPLNGFVWESGVWPKPAGMSSIVVKSPGKDRVNFYPVASGGFVKQSNPKSQIPNYK